MAAFEYYAASGPFSTYAPDEPVNNGGNGVLEPDGRQDGRKLSRWLSRRPRNGRRGADQEPYLPPNYCQSCLYCVYCDPLPNESPRTLRPCGYHGLTYMRWIDWGTNQHWCEQGRRYFAHQEELAYAQRQQQSYQSVPSLPNYTTSSGPPPGVTGPYSAGQTYQTPDYNQQQQFQQSTANTNQYPLYQSQTPHQHADYTQYYTPPPPAGPRGLYRSSTWQNMDYRCRNHIPASDGICNSCRRS